MIAELIVAGLVGVLIGIVILAYMREKENDRSNERIAGESIFLALFAALFAIFWMFAIPIMLILLFAFWVISNYSGHIAKVVDSVANKLGLVK